MIDKDYKDFIDEVYKIVGIIEVSEVEKMELDVYQRKVFSKVYFKKWKE